MSLRRRQGLSSKGKRMAGFSYPSKGDDGRPRPGGSIKGQSFHAQIKGIAKIT
jgi:hypothetical protein